MTFVQLLPWILAGAAATAAFFLLARLRATAADLETRAAELERIGAELKVAREQIDRQSATHRRRGEELAELRRKLDKAKKRGSNEPRSGRAAAPSHLQEVERELELARQARDAAREEASGLASELSRLRAQPAPAAPPAPPDDSERIARVEAQRDQAEARAGQLAAEFAAAQKQVQRLRGKHDTQAQLYAALRGELEAKKDRLRRQQEEIERLQALKVAVLDPLPPEPEPGEEISPS